MRMSLTIIIMTYISFPIEHGISDHGREEEGDAACEPL